jgi:hypothetical protein
VLLPNIVVNTKITPTLMCAGEVVLENLVPSTKIVGRLGKNATGRTNVKNLPTMNASQIPIAQAPFVMFVAKEKITGMAGNASLIHVSVGTVQQTGTVVVKGSAASPTSVLLIIARNAIESPTVLPPSIVVNRDVATT